MLEIEHLYPDNCQTRIYHSRGLAWYQCKKKVKVEVDGKKYCAIHSPEAIKLRNKKADEKFEKKERFLEKMAINDAIRLLKDNGYKIIKP